jgi:hypothetical protein
MKLWYWSIANNNFVSNFNNEDFMAKLKYLLCLLFLVSQFIFLIIWESRPFRHFVTWIDASTKLITCMFVVNSQPEVCEIVFSKILLRFHFLNS